MNNIQFVKDFINAARAIYESHYGDEIGEDATISAEMTGGKKIEITIMIKKQEDENETD